MPAPRHSITRLLLVLSLPLFILDQATKWWVVQHFAPPPPHEGFWVIPDWFEITRVHNMGVAFGLGNGHVWANWVFGGISILAFGAILVMARRGYFPGFAGNLAAALLLAGIPGNLLDRLTHGYVVDFIHARLPLYDKLVPSSGGWWPAFNVADSCICVAAMLLFVVSFQPMPEKPADTTAPTKPN